MKIFDFFYSEKVIFHKNKKNPIIAQQKEGLAIHTARDDNGRVWDRGRSHPDSVRLFFSIPKLVSFKILKLVPFTFYFCFYFLILIFYICCFIFIILKLIFFIKIKIL